MSNTVPKQSFDFLKKLAKNNHRDWMTENKKEYLESEKRLKQFYAENFSPSVARLHVVGDVNKSETLAAAEGLKNNWEAKEVNIPDFQIQNDREKWRNPELNFRRL